MTKEHITQPTTAKHCGGQTWPLPQSDRAYVCFVAYGEDFPRNGLWDGKAFVAMTVRKYIALVRYSPSEVACWWPCPVKDIPAWLSGDDAFEKTS